MHYLDGFPEKEEAAELNVLCVDTFILHFYVPVLYLQVLCASSIRKYQYLYYNNHATVT